MKRQILSLLIALSTICSYAVPTTIKPGLTCDTAGCTYYLNFSMPNFSLLTDTLPALSGDVYFSRIEPEAPDEFDYYEVDGRPTLPFYSINLILPPDASDVMVVNVQIIDSIILHLPYDYTPAQQRIDFSNGISFDTAYYSTYNNTWYWMYDSINVLDYRKYKGFCMSIFPCRYEPSDNALIVITEATYEISYNGTIGISEYIEGWLDKYDGLAINFFDNFVSFPYVTIPPIDHDEYLIITADEWENNADLADFVLHKESLGYNVTLKALHTIGHTPDSIRNYIRGHYLEKDTKYVLLIGTVEENLPASYKLPFYDGQDSTMSDPSSDIYYSCLNYPTISQQYWDFTPTVYVGRWPVQNEDQLNRVIKKTTKSDLSLGTFCPTKITLFSGSDSHNSYMENFFYNDCMYIYDNIIQEYDRYTGWVVDGRAAGIHNMEDSLTNHADPIWLFVYDGHGGSYYISNPYCLFSSDISAITTNTLDFQPFGFGFACLLGNIFHQNNFARAWLTSTEGGVTFFGPTSTTTTISDRYFSRDLFNQLKKKSSMTIGEFVGNGKAKYYCDGHKVVWRRREAKRYNLYGDPSLYLHGLLFETAPYPVLPKMPQIDKQQDDILYIDQTEVESVFVYSIAGQLLLTGNTNQLDMRNLPTGIYTIIINADNQQSSKKIIKL